MYVATTYDELKRIRREVDETVHTWGNRLKQAMVERGEKPGTVIRALSIYSDGSCNNGEDKEARTSYGGVHAFVGTHSESPTKVQGHIATDRGYHKAAHVENKSVDAVVLDIRGNKVPVKCTAIGIEQSFDMATKLSPSFDMPNTNQRAEVLAMLVSLRSANIMFSKGLIKHAHIRSDSEYALNGTTKWCRNWKRNHFISGGKPIKNDDLWTLVFDEVDLATKQNREITFQWVKGHRDHLGNIYADRIAGSAKLFLQDQLVRFVDKDLGDQSTEEKPVEIAPVSTVNYEICDMMRAYPRWYYYSRTPEEKESDRAYYYVGRHGKENNDEEFGFMMGETVHGVTYVNKQPMLELLAKSFEEQTEEERWAPERIYIVDLGLASGKEFIKSVVDTELAYIDKTGDNYTFQDKKVVASRKYPIVAGWDALDNFLFLKSILRDKQAGTLSDKQCLTDVTHLFYGIKTNEKTGKSVDIVLPLEDQTMKVKVRHKPSTNSEIRESMIKMSRNIDFPLRKPFIGSLGKEPKVEVITWHEGKASFRYALILSDSSGDCSIWSASHSNLKILTPKEMRE